MNTTTAAKVQALLDTLDTWREAGNYDDDRATALVRDLYDMSTGRDPFDPQVLVDAERFIDWYVL